MESLIFWNPKRRPLRIVRCFACKRPFMRGSLNKLHPGLRTLDSRILNSFRLIAPSPYPPPARPVHDSHHFRLDYRPTSWRGYSPSFVPPPRRDTPSDSVCVNFANTTDSARFKHNYYFNYSRRETGLSTNSFHGYKGVETIVVVPMWCEVSHQLDSFFSGWKNNCYYCKVSLWRLGNLLANIDRKI